MPYRSTGNKKTAWNQFLARTPGVPCPTRLTSLPRRSNYGICNLSLTCSPAKRGLNGTLVFKDSNKCYLLICKFLFILFFRSFNYVLVLLLVVHSKLHQIGDSIHSAEVMKGEKLVVKNHPVFSFLHREFLDVREKTDGHNDYPTVSKYGAQLASMSAKIKTFYSDIGFFNLSHYSMFLIIVFSPLKQRVICSLMYSQLFEIACMIILLSF